MKLARYTTTRLSLVLFLLIGIWGTFFYFAMVREIMDETDDELRSYRNIIIKRAESDSNVLISEKDIFYRYSVNPISQEEAAIYQEQWKDVEEYFPIEHEHIPMRVYISSFCTSDNQCYELDLRISTTERDDLLQSLFIYLILLYALLLICIFFSINIILRRSFIPLQKLLIWFKNVRTNAPIPPLENDTVITEFQSLNEAALAMTQRNVEIYEEQKQFIENASHELQTPLAVALNKLELLAESEDSTEQQLKKIEEISKSLYQAVKLNKSLLLLTRINNRQYSERHCVDISQIVKENIVNLQELLDYKNISISIKERDKCMLMANETLMQILISNLLRNAMTHTKEGGNIEINIDQEKLQIWNSGTSPLDSSKIFQRFYHTDQHRESTGLGLAIVRSISDLYDIKVHYRFENGHLFLLEFPENS